MLNCFEGHFDNTKYFLESLEFKLESHTNKEKIIYNVLKTQKYLLKTKSLLEVDWNRFDDLTKIFSKNMEEYDDIFKVYFLDFQDKLCSHPHLVFRNIKRLETNPYLTFESLSGSFQKK